MSRQSDNLCPKGCKITVLYCRLSRGDLRVGLYTDVLFPEKSVRFIAISNDVDSANQQENDFTPFLNIIKNTDC